MMKKQEVIDDIENAIPDFLLNDFQRGKETGLSYALELVEQLDEPEKAVLSKEEAEWLEHLKLIANSTNCLYVITRQGWGYHFEFCSHGKKYILPCESDDGDENELIKHRLVKALIHGYEVEKEKLYTVRLKATGEFIYFKKLFQCYNSGTSVKPVAHDNKEYHHAENVLKELLFWDNPAFEIKEVKKEEE